jgi:drug/metabolite transporter (DMT)-like permease
MRVPIVIAILGGLATAAIWATTILGSARSARLIGAWSTLAWVMIVGLAFTIPLMVLTAPPITLSDSDVFHLAAAGIANTVGMLIVYTALRRGKVAIVAPIVSTEGAIAATLAIINGDPVSGVAIGILAFIAVGVVLAAIERPPDLDTLEVGVPAKAADTGPNALLTAAMALAAATLFGINMYATSRIATDLPPAWAALPARLAGFIAVAVPLLLTRRIRLTRQALPVVAWVGVAEVLGIIAFAIGSRESAAVTSVIASQFAAVAAIVAFIVFRERLTRLQVAGAIIIAVGVGTLAALQA